MELHISFDRKSLVVQQGEALHCFKTESIDYVGPAIWADKSYFVRVIVRGEAENLSVASEAEMHQVCRLIWGAINGEHTLPQAQSQVVKADEVSQMDAADIDALVDAVR